VCSHVTSRTLLTAGLAALLGSSVQAAEMFDECKASVEVIGVDDESVSFQISVQACPNTKGEYEYEVHYKEPATGKTATKVWQRGWEKAGTKSFELTEYPSKAKDEVVDDVKNEKITRCVCT